MEKFDNIIGTVINKTAIRMRLELGKLLAQSNLDVTVDQYVVLNRLYDNAGISQNELANLTYKDKSSITRIIDLLEEKGLVERRSIAGDRRLYQVYAKPKAIEIRSKLIELALQNMQCGIRNISKEDLETTINVLNKIHSNYQE